MVAHERRLAVPGRFFRVWTAKPDRHGRGDPVHQAGGRLGRRPDRAIWLSKHYFVRCGNRGAGRAIWLGRRVYGIRDLWTDRHAVICVLLEGTRAWIL